MTRFLLVLTVLGLALIPKVAAARPAAQARPEACAALIAADLAKLPDAPAQIMASNLIAASGGLPAHCQVDGYVQPRVGFRMRLPVAGWNGKFIAVGCGALCGSPEADRTATAWCEDALRRGYACILSDRGHRSSDGPGGNVGRDALWGQGDLQAKLDYGLRAAHVTAIAGKAIVERFYGQRPERSYFMGCSGGGRQGLTEAQRFPWDFDGILAMDPGPNLIATHMSFLWSALANSGPDGKPLLDTAARDLLHARVLQACDSLDGLADGVIGDPRQCRFDPEVLLCRAGQRGSCLSAAQVEAARRIYSGPVTRDGKPLFHGSMPGSEKGSAFLGSSYSENFFRHLGFLPEPGAGWSARDFDFDRDYQRFGLMDALYSPTNPDLRHLRDAGGKLLIIQGWEDSGTPLPLDTVDYYEMVERTMGGAEATQAFARLFMMPGKSHCGGGPGANGADYLAHLEAWVEQGKAPEMIVASHVETQDLRDYVAPQAAPAGAVTFTRPLYPYPLEARYRGRGDPHDYRSFAPVSSRR
ncbi:tannase/feruloyl esterase family alpha/beta hydrolase [Novosphingobium mathurense]|uniref:Feruloyl esterase n=1 Tax=Novosphingobium mathurense TaxID=428990 RepID=A0A1U6H6G4_9SPHN|nr:tannase/feruloyl esterase family alpha/beta hydrolase [Novosphingobium mathurense]SLJ91240.1 feruloyl esterase [Novosphingobium mathurense]